MRCGCGRWSAEVVYETIGNRRLVWWGSFAGDVVTQGGMTPGVPHHCIQFRPGKLWLMSHLLRDGNEMGCFRLSNLPVDLIPECLYLSQVTWDLVFRYFQ